MARRTREESAAAREAKLEQIASELESAVAELISSEDWIRAIEFAARFRSRSFGNTLLIYAQHARAFQQGRVATPYPSYVAGFQQWKQLGRHVVKGQAGYMIYAPVTARFATVDPHDPDTWRRLARRERPRPGEVVRSKMVGVKPAHVWDASQTTGPAPIPERPRPTLLKGQAPEGLWDGLAAQVRKAGFGVSLVPDAATIQGAFGVTNYADKTVQVRADIDDADRVTTLAHELAHVLMHAPTEHDRLVHSGIREVEAESVVMMIGSVYGLDTTRFSVPYVTSWSTKVPNTDPVKVVRATGERVRTVALAILDSLPEAPVGDGLPPGLSRPVNPRPTPVRAEQPGLTAAAPVMAARAAAR